jgi:hypothetical protein
MPWKKKKKLKILKKYKSSKVPTKSHTIIMTNVWHSSLIKGKVRKNIVGLLEN